jgi:hypothetical protein
MQLQNDMPKAILSDSGAPPLTDFASKNVSLQQTETISDDHIKKLTEKLGELLAALNFLFDVENKFQQSSSSNEVQGFFEIVRHHAKQVAATLAGKTSFAMDLEPETDTFQAIIISAKSSARKLFASSEAPPNSYQKKIERAIRPLAYEIADPGLCYASTEDIQEKFYTYYYPELLQEMIGILEENEALGFEEYLQEVFFKPYLSTNDISELEQYYLDTEKQLIALQLNSCFLEKIASKKIDAGDPEQVKKTIFAAIMQTSLSVYDRFSAREGGDGKIQTQLLLPCMLFLYIILNFIKPALKSDFYLLITSTIDKRKNTFFDRFFYSFIKEKMQTIDQQISELIQARVDKMMEAARIPKDSLKI